MKWGMLGNADRIGGLRGSLWVQVPVLEETETLQIFVQTPKTVTVIVKAVLVNDLLVKVEGKVDANEEMLQGALGENHFKRETKFYILHI